MRDGLKKRIRFNPENPSRLNYIKNDYIARNTFNKRVAEPLYCAPNGNCSNVQDASGFWISTFQTGQESRRHYYAPFRQPVKGYRKTTDCSGTANNNCMFTTEIYKDTYSDASSCEVCSSNGSITTSKVPVAVAARVSSGYTTRTKRPLIRSGMQPNVAGQQNSGITPTRTATQYSYSYKELIRNRRKNTYMKKLATQEPSDNYWAPGYGGSCCIEEGQGENGSVIYRLNNNKFKVQGAVDSSDRITRLKLDTIKAQSRCPPATQTGPANDRRDCNGIYRPGHMAATGTNTWPLIDPEKMGCKSKVKYTSLFNNNHNEVNYPQTSALARARGAVSFKTTANPNGGVCCENPAKPQLLM